MRQTIAHVESVNARSAGEAAGLSAPLGSKSWRGASGRSFSHTVYSLIGCPAFDSANFILVCRSADGRRDVLRIGRTETGVASLDLARIRREGAILGANEVHIYTGTLSDRARAIVAFDLATAHPETRAAAQLYA